MPRPNPDDPPRPGPRRAPARAGPDRVAGAPRPGPRATPARNPGEPSPVPWQGLHHLALATRDIDQAVRFYHGLLGMRLLYAHAGGREPALGDIPRHFWFDCGGGGTLHIFERPEHELRPPLPGQLFPPGAFLHISFRLPDEGTLRGLRGRLAAAGVEVSEIRDFGAVREIDFRDPDGNLHEAACWAIPDPTARPVDYTAFGEMGAGFTNDPEPPPAVGALIGSRPAGAPAPNSKGGRG